MLGGCFSKWALVNWGLEKKRFYGWKKLKRTPIGYAGKITKCVQQTHEQKMKKKDRRKKCDAKVTTGRNEAHRSTSAIIKNLKLFRRNVSEVGFGKTDLVGFTSITVGGTQLALRTPIAVSGSSLRGATEGPRGWRVASWKNISLRPLNRGRPPEYRLVVFFCRL